MRKNALKWFLQMRIDAGAGACMRAGRGEGSGGPHKAAAVMKLTFSTEARKPACTPYALTS